MTSVSSLNHISVIRINFRLEKRILRVRLGAETSNLVAHHIDRLCFAARYLVFSVFIEIK